MTLASRGTHRDAGGHLHTVGAGAEAFHRSPDGCPDKTLAMAGLSVECMQIGVRLPLLEQQLDLPAKPIGLVDRFGTISVARQIGHQKTIFTERFQLAIRAENASPLPTT